MAMVPKPNPERVTQEWEPYEDPTVWREPRRGPLRPDPLLAWISPPEPDPIEEIRRLRLHRYAAARVPPFQLGKAVGFAIVAGWLGILEWLLVLTKLIVVVRWWLVVPILIVGTLVASLATVAVMAWRHKRKATTPQW